MLLACAVLIWVTGCSRSTPTSTPAPAVVPPFSREEMPPDEAVAEVDKDKGGTIGLQDGTQATLPPGSLAQNATVTLRTAQEVPAVPVPMSMIGAAYELLIDGSELTGVALLRLPLAPGVTPDQYEFAPYRWTGRTWERVTARDVTGGIQFGVNDPGIFAILGRWRLADASIALIKPETLPGQQSVPLTVVGQYRFSAIPALQNELVPARLVLKQDTSGGAGQVAGDPDQDTTVDEETLWFKPDPSQSHGVIEFSHVFDLVPGLLALDPGINTRFYVSLTVDDAATPTRRISTGVEYTQVLPILIQNMEVVRPVVLQEDRLALRWKILLNGLTFQTPEARGPTLALQPIVDQGGVGDYRIILEVQRDGEWIAVSNEVSIQLAARPTATLPPGQEPVGTPAVVAALTPSAIQPPTVPTRRPTPATNGQPAVTPTATFTPTLVNAVTLTPTRTDQSTVFWADKPILTPGECTVVHWQIDNVISVYIDGQATTGNNAKDVCPPQTTTYTLRVTSSSGTQDYTVTVQVSASGQPAVVFTADKVQVASGACTTLRWSAINVKEVRLNGQGVAGIATKEECPTQTTDYTLTVLDSAGVTTTKRLTIAVIAGTESDVDVAFWAEQYTLPEQGCTTLHWRVKNVLTVYLDGEGVVGVGTQQACPTDTQYYTLEITDTAGTATIKEIVLFGGTPPPLGNTEVIGQGIVNEVSRRTDISSSEQGDQPGYDITIDGLHLLFTGASGYSQSTMTLHLPQSIIDLGDNGPVQWPVRSGQQVEFRVRCEGPDCFFDYANDAYLYWRSE